MVCRFSRVREKEIWQGCFLFCSDWGCFVFPVACCITSFSRGLVRLFFVLGCLPRGLWCVVWCYVRERIDASDAGFWCLIGQRRVVDLVSIWMFLWCFCLKIWELIMFYDIYSQWIFRKVYGGWRVWNLCVFFGEKRFILGVLCAVVWGFTGLRARDF